MEQVEKFSDEVETVRELTHLGERGDCWWWMCG